MKVVALVSGGKDSVFSLMKCVEHGHSIRCLATLQPPSSNAEVDSFMFQSIGTHVVTSIAECMELPLVVQTLCGQSVATDMSYEPTKGDEVEDLYVLLKRVLELFPDVEAVNTGAIFSNYQRTRVENVCNRLGLTSIAYLWRKNQDELMQEMIDAELNSIVVKVASMGLNPRKHLGHSIADLYPTFLDLHEKYQFHICGEGGEYETLTLDCPLFKKRIVIDEARVVIHSDDMFAPVGLYCIDALHLEDKDIIPHTKTVSHTNATITQTPTTKPTNAKHIPARITSRCFRNQIALSGVICEDTSLSLSDQVHSIFSSIQKYLAQHDVALSNVVFVHIYVRDMAQFAHLNAVYATYFPGLTPPSRSCVQVDMENTLQIDCLAIRGAGPCSTITIATQREVLYIQSLSEWAPMCIGPYCQANTVSKSVIFCAGQIPLKPETMTMLSAEMPTLLNLSYRNGARVLDAVDSNLHHVVSTLVYHTFDSSVGLDLCDQSREILQTNVNEPDEYAHELDSDQSDEENDKAAIRIALATRSPIAAVGVPMLPKAAPVEVELVALTHKAFSTLKPTSFELSENNQLRSATILYPKNALHWVFVC
ncbi:hypothetical protein THRCLA_02572 [Thraustotheca clavata]|uniref:Diphthine--ammonia ligase n=1 Tax=Thraustotheca clavata TaxID=74557 RepID=A0A1W0A4Q7_9STRA|nr:hypothetical protein THRCLA_02572 [Thraustotheca clavata]